MKICLDPGHNDHGADTGAEGNGLREQDLTLDIALRLRPLLQANGITVVMTREGGLVSDNSTLVASLQSRIDVAENAKADVFLSIHVNAGGGTGQEILIQGTGGNAERFANIMLPHLVQAGNWYNRGVKVQNIMVLRETTMPAILTENGFIDTGSDAQKLANPDFRQQLAVAHAKGVCEYFGIQYNESSSVAQPSPTPTPSSSIMYRVILDGKQTMALSSQDAATAEVKKEVDAGTATSGVVQRNTDSVNVFSYTKAVPVTPTSAIMYRVKIDNVQKMALSSQDNAIAEVKKEIDAGLGTTGTVEQNTDGVIVFTYTKPVVTTPVASDSTPIVTPIPVTTKTSILGKETVTIEQCEQFIKKVNPNATPLASFYKKYGEILGIKWGYAFSQMAKETGYLRFGNDVKVTQNNFAGIGAVGGGASGASFDTPEKGVIAHLEHLYAYASTNAIPSTLEKLDPRFDLVTRGAYPNFEDLDGHWAVPGVGYGESICEIHDSILKEVVVPVETQTSTQPVEDTPIPVVTEPKSEVNKNNIIVEILIGIFNFIKSLFVKK